MALRKGSNHKFKDLAPFVDAHGCLRIGGRLHYASIKYDTKHPYLLPRRHKVTELIIQYYHKILLHPSNLLISHIRQQFWIPRVRSTVKWYVRQCLPCFKDRAHTLNQEMAALPPYRVQQVRPFCRVGVDYGGPFIIKSSHGRRVTQWKSYLSLFICMATKAVHLEVVSDLTTSAFLATLRRFTARRGNPSDIYSDNGSNFIGTASELQQLYKLLREETTQNEIETVMLQKDIKWHFLPPHAPHFGGLWEANIKSAKTYLNRSINNHILTFEELSTIFLQM